MTVTSPPPTRDGFRTKHRLLLAGVATIWLVVVGLKLSGVAPLLEATNPVAGLAISGPAQLERAAS